MTTEVFPLDKDPKRDLATKAATITRISRQLGAFQAAGLVFERLITSKDTDTYRLVSHPNLQYPLGITPYDIAVFDETILRNGNVVPPIFYELINGRPIVDIGANIGVTAARYASTYPNSKVFAIEPHPRNLALLRQNTVPYNGQIQIIEAAVSPSTGKVPLVNFQNERKRRNGHGGHRFVRQTEVNGDVTTAPSILPEQIAALSESTQNIGLMKVDIEGAERELFHSAKIDHLMRILNLLIVETHDHKVPGSSNAVYEAAERNDFIDVSSSPVKRIRLFINKGLL